MTVVLCIALLLAVVTDVSLKGASSGAVTAVFVCRMLVVLGLATLALLSTGWQP